MVHVPQAWGAATQFIRGAVLTIALGGSMFAESPGLSYNTIFGPGPTTSRTGSAVDAQGNVYIAGLTTEDIVQVTPSAFQKTFAHGTCLDWFFPYHCPHGFVAKISADGKQLVYATYLGGNNEDIPRALAVDPYGNVYVCGETKSTNFPVTPGAYQTTPGDSFVTKLNVDGSAVLSSTYLTGTLPWSIAVDPSGNAYLTGGTSSTAFPSTPGAFQTKLAGDADAFVLKFDASLKTLQYATLLGGTSTDRAWSIAVDAQGRAYVAGGTLSGAANDRNAQPPGYSPFPTTPGALLGRDGYDAFVVKLNAAGTGLIYSAVFGGSHDDIAFAVSVDALGNAYVAGSTSSLDFPTTPHAVQLSGEGFVVKLSSDGTSLVYSTYSGGSNLIAVNSSGNTFLSGGVGFHIGFRSTPNALHPCYSDLGGPRNGFLLELTPYATGLVYSTLMDDIVAIDATGNVWTPSQTQILDRVNITVPLPPQITCLANAGNFRIGPVAPGEVVSLFGPDIGPDQPSSLQLDSTGKVGAWLGGLSVYFNGVAAPLLYVSKNQINAVVPFEIANASQTSVVILKKDAVQLPAVYLPVVASAPVIFTVGGNLSQGAILNQDGTLNTPAHPAPRGSVISIWATGAGLMQPLPADGFLGNGKIHIPLPVTVWASAPTWHCFPVPPVSLEILYAGDAPGLVEGVVQINARVTDQVPVGCWSGGTTLDLTIGNATTRATIWVK